MKYLTQAKLKEYRDKHKPTHCPILGIETDDWVLDHDHQTGMVRGVISRQANSLLGKVENFYLGMCKGKKELLPITLADMAFYLYAHKDKNLLHPVGFRQLYKRFSKFSKKKQINILLELEVNNKIIVDCKNSRDSVQPY